MVLCKPKVILCPWQGVRPSRVFLKSKLVVVNTHAKLNHVSNYPDRGILGEKRFLTLCSKLESSVNCYTDSQ